LTIVENRNINLGLSFSYFLFLYQCEDVLSTLFSHGRLPWLNYQSFYSMAMRFHNLLIDFFSNNL